MNLPVSSGKEFTGPGGVTREALGQSEAFLDFQERLSRVAPVNRPVLLIGERGTGKELAASRLHFLSGRWQGPLVALNCAALAPGLIEAELFGYEKGAFTGANQRRIGRFEMADGGTLFLDEIGDIPLSLQVKLLRVLESGMYRPVGDIEARSADFRLVCATHRDLDQMVAAGSFRRDLYFRINTFPIAMPPLRERSEDIELLCDTLLANSAKRLSEGALQLLQQHDFPGNIRELRNIVERAVLLADGVQIEAKHLPAYLGGARASVPAPPLPTQAWPWGDALLPLEEVEHRYLRWVYEAHPGDRKALAERLGVSERTLYRKLRQALEPDGHG